MSCFPGCQAIYLQWYFLLVEKGLINKNNKKFYEIFNFNQFLKMFQLYLNKGLQLWLTVNYPSKGHYLLTCYPCGI